MNTICIIGGANIDLCGSSIAPLRSMDSNPGVIKVSYGGVGRNIAQICSLMKQKVTFVTCFSSDPYGQMMKKDCEDLGMNCSLSKIVDDVSSSMYIAILDSNRDMKIGMSDMRILSKLDNETIDRALQSLDKNDLLIMDSNLAEHTEEYILDHTPCPVAADPVSVGKAGKMKGLLDRISIFKPNQYEAEELSGIWVKDDETAVACLKWFEDKGIPEVIVSLADRGVLLSANGKRTWLTHRKSTLENATGGGDTFLGAYCAQRLANKDPLQAARYAISASVITIENDAVSRRTLNTEDIVKQIDTMEIKERSL